MKVLETDRLILRHLSTDDAEFVLALVNDPSFIRYIGDKQVRTLDDARRYVLDGPVKNYETHGFGLNLVELKSDHTPIGICGVLKRDTLPRPDIGFAFLPAYWHQGYAFEAAAAVMKQARNQLGLDQILAITTPDNEASGKLLGKIGFAFDRLVKLSEDAEEVKLFSSKSMDHVALTEVGGVSPFFIVRNVPATLAFYRDRLGFEITFQGPFEDDIFFGIVQRGRSMIMFKAVGVDPLPNCKRAAEGRWDAYFYVPDPDSLAAEFASRNVEFLTPLGNNSDDLRGFEIQDSNGYVLFFGRPLDKSGSQNSK